VAPTGGSDSATARDQAGSGGDESGTPAESPADEERRLREIHDRQLVRRLKAGDQRAFEEMVRTYQNRIFGLLYRMIGNRQEAEDLAQEVFITVHRAIGSYRGEGRFYTWLYRIASNTCKNRMKYLKGRHHNRRVSVDDAPEVPASTTGPALQSHVPGPEAVTEGNRLEQAIQHELANLDEEYRLLIILRDVQGLSYQDILRITGLQEGTLKSRLHRARLALKERLTPHIQ
jgi:RNA polymerase sigma-70 factor (ECF subfamily)